MIKNEKKNRKETLRKLREKKKSDLIATLPFAPEDAKSFFDFLNDKLPEFGCSHSFKIVKEFCSDKKINFENIEPWLNSNGAWCDCEVIANVEQEYESLI
ncbi:MAG: DUF2695 domain-containing protein [Oligoflexales bacterium]